MKRVLFTICLLSAASLVSYGQSTMNRSSASATVGVSVNIAEQQETASQNKLILTSKVNEMDGALSRKAQNRAQEIFTEIDGMMIEEINNGGDNVAEQKRLYSDITILSADMMPNRAALKAKLEEFLKTI